MRRGNGKSLVLAYAAGVVVVSSCLLTSSFDDLTGGLPADGGPSSSSSSASAGGATASSASSASSASATTGTGGQGGGGGGGGIGGASSSSASSSSSSSSGSGGSGGMGGFPVTNVLDDFNRPDGAPGKLWLFENPGGFVINANQLASVGMDPGTIIWGAQFGADQEAFVTFEKLDPMAVDQELILKNQGNVSECEAILVDYTQGDVSVYGCVNNNFNEVGNVAVVFQPGDQFGARALADGTVLVFKNGVQIGMFNVAGVFPAFAGGGRIGWADYGLPGGVVIDDFGGG